MKASRIALVGILTAAALTTTALAAIDRNPNTLRATLRGSQEVPPNRSQATGNAIFDVFPAQGRFCYAATFRGVQAHSAHIHRGASGVSGRIVIGLWGRQRSSPASGCRRNIRRNLLREIRNFPERFYMNIHSERFPGGEIRGQLRQR